MNSQTFVCTEVPGFELFEYDFVWLAVLLDAFFSAIFRFCSRRLYLATIRARHCPQNLVTRE